MDKISEILKNVKERLSNPLIFSFLLSWVIYNWKVTVALLWYDPKQFQSKEVSTIFDFITTNTNCYSYLIPIGFAITYTLLVPPIKVLISAFNTLMSTKSENWNLKIAEGHNVSMNKYLSLRNQYNERSKTLEEIISAESADKKKVVELTDALLSEKTEHSKTLTNLASHQEILGQMRNVKILDGNWIVTLMNHKGEYQLHERIEISTAQIFIVGNTGGKEKTYSIDDFFYDARSQQLNFVRRNILTNVVYYDSLKYEYNELIGTENHLRIKYTRQSASI